MKKIIGIITLVLITTVMVSAQNVQKVSSTKTIRPVSDSTLLQLKVEGMMCQRYCANGIDEMLDKTQGVLKSKTTYATGTSLIWYDNSIITESKIIALIEDRGFKARKMKGEKDE